MANMKITVVGDGAEEPLTPEEEHRIEVKIDEMLDPSLPDKTPETFPEAAIVTKVAEVTPQVATPATVAAPEISPSPQVTRIVPTFADEPEIEHQPETAATRPAVPKPAAEEVLPAKKTITVKHFDEPESDKPEKVQELEKTVEPAQTEPHKTRVKAVRSKVTTKKHPKKKPIAATKTPDDDLASKADAIAASALMAEEMMGTKQPKTETTPEAEQSLEKAAPPTEVPDILPDSVEDTDGGAPPLIQKHAAPIITPPQTSAPDTSAPASIQKSTTVNQGLNAEEQPAATSDESTVQPLQPTHKTEIAITEIPDEAENIEVDVEQKAAVASPAITSNSADNKKYRPPEGPLQFKRAEVPIKPQKPGEPRTESAASAEITEDEALLRAFESPKPTHDKVVARSFVGAAAKLLKWTAITLIILSIVAVAVVPALRTKALNMVGLNNTKPVSTSNTAPKSASTAAETALNPAVYIARRAGVYNLYKMPAGGQEQLILAGTGKEEDDLVLAPNANSSIAALVSTRDGKEDAAGIIQQSIALVTVNDGRATAVDSADQVKIVDWFGERIVYVLVNTSTDTTDTNRYQLVSYDTVKKVRTVLDRAAYLNDVLSAKGNIYYATSTSTRLSGQFIKIQPDGTAKRPILAAEIAAITRTAYDSVTLAGTNKWYSYELDALQAAATNNASQGVSRLYIASPDTKRAAYIGEVAGANKLIVFDTETRKETILEADKVSYPIHWLSDDTIVYRSNSSDYSIKISGGQGVKIADVFDAAGISLWHEL